MATANFVGFNATLSGYWPGHFGADGFYLPPTSGGNPPAYSSPPSYIQLSFPQWTQGGMWGNPTNDPRGTPTSAATGSPACAGFWVLTAGQTINIAITDGGTHRLTIYVLDFSRFGWTGQYQVQDHATGQVLDARTTSADQMAAGTFLTWAISGNVDLSTIATSGSLPVCIVSGLFFDPSPSVPTTITLTTSANPAVSGQQVTFTATVAPLTGTAAPTGTVTFYDTTDPNNPIVLGTGTLS